MFSSSPISKLVPAAALSLVLGLPAVVSADTITVCWDGSGDYLTIQEGIDAASDGDEVVVCDGVYTGPGNKNLDFGGRAITVRSENGPDNCVIDCEGDGRGFYFHSGETETSVVDGFSIVGGHARWDTPGGRRGGAVLCEDLSSPTIVNCTITGNTADHEGGGIYCEDSSPTIRDCTVIGNTADDGGGVYCAGWYEESSPVISNCAISGNLAWGGGGLYCWDADPSLLNCEISGNTAHVGGGVYCDLGDPTIDNCTITGNTAGRGGGIYCGSSSATISNCTFSENTIAGESGEGAGIYCWWVGELTITNCVITANIAEEEYCVGGGVYCQHSNPTISNCIIAGNQAWSVGGVMCSHASPTLINNLVTGNSSGGVSCQHWSNPVVINCTFTLNGSAGIHCLVDSNPTVTNCILWWDTISVHASEPVVSYCDVQGGWPGEGNIDADPLFVDPDGPDDDLLTWEDNDFRLAGGSPCVDAGCNMAVPPDVADLDGDGDTTEATPLDLDGEGRFFDDPDTDDTGCGCPPIVDMGAYEFGDAGPQPCPGDLDCDRVVGHSDLGILLSAWHSSDEGDLNCDGVTGHADLGILLAYWGNVCP